MTEAIGGGVALLRGSGPSGGFDYFRQNNDFYYLCGVETPVAYLMLAGRRTTLYLPHRDPHMERSEGAQLSAEDVELARRLTGVDDVRPLEMLRKDLAGVQVLHIPMSPAEGKQACRDTLLHARKTSAADPFAEPAPELWLRDGLAKAIAGVKIEDLSPVLDRLRVIKSAKELAVMRRAGKLSAMAVEHAMRCTRVGQMEFELAAVAECVYLMNGARGGGYRAIIAGGANIWNPHYFRNDCELQDGELVLMDYAPDCGNYTSDIGRMWPVNGKYSAVQRELYGFVVEYHKVLLGLIRPGVTTEQIVEEAAVEMLPRLEGWAWSKPAYQEAAKALLKFQGSLSHGVGMAVHDVGNYRSGPLAPGMVFALDPQMWVHDEQVYIRVEDTVAVTETGVENLTEYAPLSLDDVAELMRQNEVTITSAVPLLGN